MGEPPYKGNWPKREGPLPRVFCPQIDGLRGISSRSARLNGTRSEAEGLSDVEAKGRYRLDQREFVNSSPQLQEVQVIAKCNHKSNLYKSTS
jgi:hypothetical protein